MKRRMVSGFVALFKSSIAKLFRHILTELQLVRIFFISVPVFVPRGPTRRLLARSEIPRVQFAISSLMVPPQAYRGFISFLNKVCAAIHAL